MGTWLIFDDDTVDSIKECDIPKYFGDSNSGSAYVLYYQALDIDLSALGLRPPSPEPVMQPVSQSEPPQPLQPTDSPVSTAQSIPPLPPGLADDFPGTASVPELPRPATPPVPIQSPLEPPAKSPRKVPSQFLKAALGRPATVGHSSRNETVIRPSRSVVDEKFSSVPTLSLSPITIFPKEDLKPLEGHSAGAVSGKERDSDRSMSMMGWLRRRSLKAGKSRPSLEVTPDMPPLPQDVLAAPGSPVRNQSTGSSSKSSKDSRRPLDSPTPGHASLLPIGKLLPLSRTSYETDSKRSSAFGDSYTTPISPPPDRRSQSRPLPAIPASPQTPKIETPPSPFSRTSLDHSRVQRRPGTSSFRDSNLSLSPKSPGRPSTSAGPPTMTRSPHHIAPPSSSLQVPSPNIATGKLGPKRNSAVVERPKSAHASYGIVLSSPTSPVPPVPVSVTGPTRKPAMRKLSLSAPMLGLVRRDKDKQ
jgi:ubiquitin carboxyl-terminal hydrolase 9/13